MAKQDAIKIDGVISDTLPNASFRGNAGAADRAVGAADHDCKIFRFALIENSG